MHQSKQLSVFVNRAIPEYISEDYPQFALFLTKYFEYLERDMGEYTLVVDLLDNLDIDRTMDVFLPEFKNAYTEGLPEKIIADVKLVIKRIRDFYTNKGTEDSLRFLFRTLFDTEIEIFYPKDDILRASDGKWIEPYYLTTLDTQENATLFYDKFIIGSVSGATAYVESIEYISSKWSLSLTGLSGTFVASDVITEVDTISPTIDVDSIELGTGYWANNDGFISDKKYLQDSDYYQDFSYVIKSEIPSSSYRDIIIDNVHPAGMKLFSELVTKDVLELTMPDLILYTEWAVQWINSLNVNPSSTTVNVITLEHFISATPFDFITYEVNRETVPWNIINQIEGTAIGDFNTLIPENFIDITVGGVEELDFSIDNKQIRFDTAPVQGHYNIKVINNDASCPEAGRVSYHSGDGTRTVFEMNRVVNPLKKYIDTITEVV